MTIHLYYDDSYLREFAATVLEIRQTGTGFAAVLDRTAFYPDSGGQPHDSGTLGPARVVAVDETDSGEILHVVDGAVDPGPVVGRIDWERRFDHMQQHTGQHILSQAFLQVAEAPTVSFHLGQETCTIDLALAEAFPSTITAAEQLAARIVFEDRPVQVLTASRSELAQLGVRKESHREGAIRVIDIEAFDRSPCGGTHVRRTGEVGLIGVLNQERYKGGTRVEFVCGGRALRALREKNELLKGLGRMFSSHARELPQNAEKLLEERVALTRENTRLKDTLLEFEARELIGRADEVQGIKLVRANLGDRSLESAKVLAQKVTSAVVSIVILVVGKESAQVAVSKSKGAPGDCGQAIKQAAAKLGGKGGGRPESAQAGGIPGPRIEEWMVELEERFRDAIRATA
jgi:alanyl-tRNA synthetase